MNHGPRLLSPGVAWLVLASLLAGGCASRPPLPYVVELPAGVEDGRARFGDVFCTVLDVHGKALPDYEPCASALSPVRDAPPRAGGPVDLGYSKARLVAAVVPGIGYGCVSQWMKTDDGVRDHLRRNGYDLRVIDVDALSGTARNAERIRDALLAAPTEPGPPRLVLVGYSKGAPDVLEAVVSYPEIRGRIAAIVSVAGAVGGSPLAEDAHEWQVDLLRYFPGADCDKGDDLAVASLRPELRRKWLAEHPLPDDVRFYSLVTLPAPERVSLVMKPSEWKLDRIDARNDAQLLYTDQIVPGSTVLGFVNADHWAVVLPIARAHPVIGALFVTENDYPRAALLESVLRYVEEDLAQASR